MLEARTEACVVRASDGAGGELRLRARLSQGRQGGQGGAVVAPPHPRYGGTLDNPVVAAAVRGLSAAGLATLAFNFRGVEGSEGAATDDLAAAVSDYDACLDHLAGIVRGPYIAAGYSFGAGTAALVAASDTRVAGLVMVAPPVGMLRAEDLVAFAGPVLVIVGDDDDYAPLPQLTEILRVRPDCALETLKNTDHFFHYGAQSEIDRCIATQVRAWLARNGAAGP